MIRLPFDPAARPAPTPGCPAVSNSNPPAGETGEHFPRDISPGDLELIETLFDRVPVMITVYQPNTRVLRVNAEFERVTGWNTQQAAGASLMEECYPDPDLRQRVRQFMDSLQPGWLDIPMRTRAGITIETSWANIRLSDDRRVGIGLDLRERKRSELALARQLERLQLVYELADAVVRAEAPDEIFGVSMEGLMRALRADRSAILLGDADGVMRFRTWKGLSDGYRRQVEGHSPWRADEPDPQPVMIQDVAACQDLGHLRNVVLDEGIGALAFIPLVTGRRLLGKFMVYFNAPRHFDPEEVRLAQVIAGHVAFALERLRHDEAMRRFRRLADAMPQVAWTADANGRITFINEQWQAYTGLNLAQTQDLETVRQLIHPEDAPHAFEQWERCLESGRPHEVQWRFKRHSDGTWRWFLTRAVPVKDSSGRIVEWFGTATDIHEQKLAEQALREADRRKDEFLAMLGHELRNPLAPVRNAVQVLQMAGPTEPKLVHARQMIERQVAHMSRLIDDLLDVSRITRGKIQLKREPWDLCQIIRTTVNDHRGMLADNGLSLATDLPDTPLWVRGDRTRLAQVVGNLLHNANKFTDPGGMVHVRLSVDTHQDGSAWAQLSVSDTGIGMDPATLAHAFEPFSQADRSIDRSRGGLGLGLALVKGLIELHGGEVNASSPGPGHGSEFVIRLPVVAAPASSSRGPDIGSASAPAGEVARAPAAAQRIGADAADGPARSSSALRVLVVDDNLDSARSMTMLVKLWGHQPHTAHDGPGALDAAARCIPHVVLLDIGLPGMSGYDVARELRRRPELRDTTLIAMTGYGQEEDRRRTREAGFDLHLVKPLEPQALQQMLSALHAAKAPTTPAS